MNHTIKEHSETDIKIRSGKYAAWSVADALERGDTAEALFVKIMLSKGYKITRATDLQDMYEHWDYSFTHPNPSPEVTVPFTVDIKARKRFAYLGNNPQDIYMCVEIMNTIGRKGWLYGKADYIAFERKHDFLLVPLPDIYKLMMFIFSPESGYHKNVELDKNNANSFSLPYKFMRRPGKKDLFYWISTQQLMKECKGAVLRKI